MLCSFTSRCSLMSLHEMSLLLSEELSFHTSFHSGLISVEHILLIEFPTHSFCTGFDVPLQPWCLLKLQQLQQHLLVDRQPASRATPGATFSLVLDLVQSTNDNDLSHN